MTEVIQQSLSVSFTNMPVQKDFPLDVEVVLDAFRDAKNETDNFIANVPSASTYASEFLPRSDEVSIAVLCSTFEKLGCKVRSAAPGARLDRVKSAPTYEKLIDHLYGVLEKSAGLVELKGDQIIRTNTPCPSDKIDALLDDLLRDRPNQYCEVGIMKSMAHRYAECLLGQADPVQLIFGDEKVRKLFSELYSSSDACKVVLQQFEAFIKEVASSAGASPLRILEVGAGTGGTTRTLVPALAALGVPVVYTFTDISPSLVSQAASDFAQYPFMMFRPLDLEQEPHQELLSSQHIVLGSNVIHATRDVYKSLKCCHKMLREDGFLIFHEMTAQMLWTDVAFGLIGGWWRFSDGRTHALQNAQFWSKVLKAVGYGIVDWTDGKRPETKLQKLIFATASNPGEF